MTLPGETIHTGAPKICRDCRQTAMYQVMSSMVGYYVGTVCDCGPYSRETGYFQRRKDAANALRLILRGQALDPRAKIRT